MQDRELFAKDRKKLIVLVIYDITNSKKRMKMVKCLERYALRVQRSCFEGLLTLKQCKNLETEASCIINEETDSLRIYILQDCTRVKVWGKGSDTREYIDDVIIC